MKLLHRAGWWCALTALCSVAAEVRQFDLVVYGGTAGGVITAVAAGREGLKVALVDPARHIGGMVTGGLSRTDYGKKETVGGLSLEFYERLGALYGKPVAWYPEPHQAEGVLHLMLNEAGVKVYTLHRLREKGGVRKSGARIASIRMENDVEFRAPIFADATYEGDLMAQAGVSYTWGRESAKEYGESLAGVRPKDRNHQFDMPISAYGEDGKLLPEIQKEPRGEIGAGDRKVQAYNFRMILTDNPDNLVPFPRPPDYDPHRFTLLARWLEALAKEKGRDPKIDEILLPHRLDDPAKADFNNRGAFSTDYIGASWEYPNASYARREQIWQDHINYTKGLFYFLANDPRVPAATRAEIRKWGLARDEFTDNNNWPYQLYIREARRMIGEYVMTQKDIQDELTKPDVIGMGSYNSDSHNVQRFVQPDRTVQNEGNMEVPVTPYQIPYRMILPKRKEAGNLLVPVCFSASHVAYSTLRMEPVYMIIGHAAGLAAKLAHEKKTALHDIDVPELQRKLLAQRAVFEWKPPAPGE